MVTFTAIGYIVVLIKYSFQDHNLMNTENNQIYPVSSRVTIKDVARKAGVSTTTVSRVLNKKGQVAKETIEKVMAIVNEVNFVPQAAAKGLRIQKTFTVGFLVLELSAPFQFYLLKGIEAASRELGFFLLIQSTNGELYREFPFRGVGEHNTDGLLVLAGSMDEKEIKYLYKRNFPFVLLCQSAPKDLNIPHVVFENKSGARKMTDHLIETHDYKNIAFLSGPSSQEDYYWREQGFLESLKAHHIEIDPELIAMGGFDETIAKETVSKWMDKNVKIDAIFAGDDESAVGAILAIREAGKRVPEDIAVVGFDDSVITHENIPPLTTVRSPIEEMGKRGMQLLVQLIQTKKADFEILLPTELIIRHSCGCNYLDKV